MFDTLITRLFPAAMLGGLALYALATMLWLQPLVERRMAEKYLIPACEAGLAQDQIKAASQQSPAQSEVEIALGMLDMLMAGTGLDQVPEVGQSIDAARTMADQLTPQPPRISQIDRQSICGCSVDQAFRDAGFGMTFHVASARTYASSAITALPQSTLRHALSGACGALPWKG